MLSLTPISVTSQHFSTVFSLKKSFFSLFSVVSIVCFVAQKRDKNECD